MTLVECPQCRQTVAATYVGATAAHDEYRCHRGHLISTDLPVSLARPPVRTTTGIVPGRD